MTHAETQKVYSEVCRMYQEGQTAQQLADAFGFSVASIYRALRLGGVEHRFRKGLRGDRSREILERFRKGERGSAIASALGISRQAVSQVLKRDAPPPASAA